MTVIARDQVDNRAVTIIANDCMSVGNRIATIDLSGVETCDPIDSKSYIRQTQVSAISILYKSTAIRGKITRCKLHATIRSANNGQGFFVDG